MGPNENVVKHIPSEQFKLVSRAARFANNERCFYCGGKATQADHIVPLAKGGMNWAHNLIASCKPCNLSKRSNWLPEAILEEALRAANEKASLVIALAAHLKNADKNAKQRVKHGAVTFVRATGVRATGDGFKSLDEKNRRSRVCYEIAERYFGTLWRTQAQLREPLWVRTASDVF